MPTEAVAARTAIKPSDAHVLIVEDNIQNFVLLARLMAFRCQVVQWSPGWQVLSSPTACQVDLILMDIHLPYGRPKLQRHAANSRFRDTVVCHGRRDGSTMSRAREVGFNGLSASRSSDRLPTRSRRSGAKRSVDRVARRASVTSKPLITRAHAGSGDRAFPLCEWGRIGRGRMTNE
jgi:CheY-like chemotaxis protein